MGGEIPEQYFRLWSEDEEGAAGEYKLYKSRLEWARESQRIGERRPA